MNSKLFGLSKNKQHFIALSAIMISLTVVVQYLSSLFQNQLITGSVVNMMLIISTFISGLIGSILISFVTPFMAFLIGLSSNIIMTPFIAIGNIIYCVVFYLIKNLLFKLKHDKLFIELLFLVIAIVVASLFKYLFMYFVLYKVVIVLLIKLKAKALAVVFGITQLFTALIGGTLALILYKMLERTPLFKK